jgi:hypothetical protein
LGLGRVALPREKRSKRAESVHERAETERKRSACSAEGRAIGCEEHGPSSDGAPEATLVQALYAYGDDPSEANLEAALAAAAQAAALDH